MEPYDIKLHHNPSHANPIQDLLPFCLAHKTILSATNLNMQPVEFIGQHSLPHANMPQNPDSSTDFFDRFLTNSQVHFSHHIFSPNTTSSSLTNDTTIDEAREYQPSIIHEKRLKRMISNRESARRSRMRKKKQIEALQSQVNHLQTMNHQLSEKVIRLLECNHQILQENAQLKEKVSSLQIVITDQLLPPINCLRAEASNRSPHY